MKPTFREMKRQARGILHETLAEPVLYLVDLSVVDVEVTVRFHTTNKALGALAGSDGFAEVDTFTPKAVFLNAQVQPVMNAILITKDMGAYKVGNVLPEHDITTTAEIAEIPKSQLMRQGWSPDLPWMGFTPPSNA